MKLKLDLKMDRLLLLFIVVTLTSTEWQCEVVSSGMKESVTSLECKVELLCFILDGLIALQSNLLSFMLIKTIMAHI